MGEGLDGLRKHITNMAGWDPEAMPPVVTDSSVTVNVRMKTNAVVHMAGVDYRLIIVALDVQEDHVSRNARFQQTPTRILHFAEAERLVLVCAEILIQIAAADLDFALGQRNIARLTFV